MFERFTKKAKKAIAAASEECDRMGHDYIGTEHQLLGLLATREGVAFDVLAAVGVTYTDVDSAVRRRLVDSGVDRAALAAVGIDLDTVREAVDATFGEGTLDRAVLRSSRRKTPPFTPGAKKVMEFSLREALGLDHNYIGTEHLLLAIIREGDGLAAAVLRDLAPEVDLRGRVLDEMASRQA
jgi:ATP-dependent Clp protease ATP-binding subunit ClpA